MTLAELITDLESKVLTNGVAASFDMNWLSDITKINRTYDFYLLTPPVMLDQSPRNRQWRNYRIVAYLFRQKKSGTARMTDAQRNAAWSELMVSVDKMTDAINADHGNMTILGEIEHTPDDSSLGNDNIMWIKSTFILRVNNC